MLVGGGAAAEVGSADAATERVKGGGGGASVNGFEVVCSADDAVVRGSECEELNFLREVLI